MKVSADSNSGENSFPGLPLTMFSHGLVAMSAHGEREREFLVALLLLFFF